MKRFFKLSLVLVITVMMTFFLFGCKKTPKEESLSRVTVDINPSIELLDKENGGELPLAKITYKKDLANKLLVPIGMDEKKEKYYMDFHSVPVLFIS